MLPMPQPHLINVASGTTFDKRDPSPRSRKKHDMDAKTAFAVPGRLPLQSVASLQERFIAGSLLYLGLIGLLWQFSGL